MLLSKYYVDVSEEILAHWVVVGRRLIKHLLLQLRFSSFDTLDLLDGDLL